MYLRQKWVDPRLQFEPFYINKTLYKKIKLADGAWKKIWTPDVFFRNEKQASFHSVTTPNRLIFLHSNGTVWYVSKYVCIYFSFMFRPLPIYNTEYISI